MVTAGEFKNLKMEKLLSTFLKEIAHEKDKYKLVNKCFIVKYETDEVCFYIGEFWNDSIKKIKFNPTPNIRYYPKKNLRLNSLGFWKPLTIKWIEEDL